MTNLDKTKQNDAILSLLLEQIALPDSYEELAKKRYNAIGDFLKKEEGISKYSPHIYSQGSFRLGTVIKPINPDEDYDLDIVCLLETNITKETHTQKELVNIVRQGILAYKNSVGIQSNIEKKHRCLCLNYKSNDSTVGFHIDIVPAIPKNNEKNVLLCLEASHKDIESLSSCAINITDDRNTAYEKISQEWEISNPMGYAKWFEKEMSAKKNHFFAEKKLDPIPNHMGKTTLQQSIQLLKRHRDVMFQNNGQGKPISIIITTLATRAYQGEESLKEALFNILGSMGRLVNQNVPRVPNPVRPEEDFADKWGSNKQLENNFNLWLVQAKADFENLFLENTTLQRTATAKFSVSIPSEKLKDINPRQKSIADVVLIENPLKPWCEK